ncbi:proline-rich protein HaeIII subfamily 1-like [Cynocephalus volans]|uniref:proline-rich protein HaeIII subfamily 1-like n=1 Tax=Cynocephalus volans TaxID=110931 RepID=UPI002FC9730C
MSQLGTLARPSPGPPLPRPSSPQILTRPVPPGGARQGAPGTEVGGSSGRAAPLLLLRDPRGQPAAPGGSGPRTRRPLPAGGSQNRRFPPDGGSAPRSSQQRQGHSPPLFHRARIESPLSDDSLRSLPGDSHKSPPLCCPEKRPGAGALCRATRRKHPGDGGRARGEYAGLDYRAEGTRAVPTPRDTNARPEPPPSPASRSSPVPGGVPRKPR